MSRDLSYSEKKKILKPNDVSAFYQILGERKELIKFEKLNYDKIFRDQILKTIIEIFQKEKMTSRNAGQFGV